MTAESSPQAPSGIRLRWLIVIVAAVACLLYVRTVTYEFVTYDDYDLIYQNEQFLSQPSNIFGAFATNAFTSHRSEGIYYRPVLLAGYVVEYQVWKLNPAGYHAVNVVLHAAASVFVLLLLLRLNLPALAALGGALLFAVHPVQTEAVAWVAGRNDVLLGLFVVASLLAFLHYRANGHWRWLAVSLLAFALALFTKESAAFSLLLFPLAASCAPGKTPRRALVSALFIATLIGFIVARAYAVGAVIGTEQLYQEQPFLQRLASSPAMFAEYLRFVFAPFALSVVHLPQDAFWLNGGWKYAAAAVALVALVLLVYGYRNNRPLFFGIGWVVVGLLPALNVIPIAVPILEHRLYLPMAGIAIAVGSAAGMLEVRMGKWVIAVAFVFVLACAVTAFERTPVWQNSETLWLDAMAKSPSGSAPYFNLAGYYYEHERYDDAVRLMKEYVRLRPEDPMGYNQLRKSFFAAGKFADAAGATRQLIDRSPKNPDHYAEAAELYLEAGSADSAVVLYKLGITAVPQSFYLHDLLGRLYVRLGKDTLAVAEYEAALDINPRFAAGYFDLGALCASIGQEDRAIRLLERGIRLAPVPHDILQLLHQLYLDTGQPQKAEALRKQFPY